MAFSPQIMGTPGPDELSYTTPILGGTPVLIEGLEGDDTLFADVDLDGASINGDAGDDQVIIDVPLFLPTIEAEQFSVLNSTIGGGEGDDALLIGAGAGYLTDFLSSVVHGDEGDDAIYGYGETFAKSTIEGGDGDDGIAIEVELEFSENLVDGNGGDDYMEVYNLSEDPGLVNSTFHGGDGDDTLFFEGEDDCLHIDNSLIQGEADDDLIQFEYVELIDSVVEGNEGDDTIAGYEADLVSSTVRGGADDDLIIFIDACDEGSSESFINGNDGADTIGLYDLEADLLTVMGGQQDDKIYIDSDFTNSRLNGNKENDFIEVGSGVEDNAVAPAYEGQGKGTDNAPGLLKKNQFPGEGKPEKPGPEDQGPNPENNGSDWDVDGSTFLGGQGQDTIFLHQEDIDGSITVMGNKGADLMDSDEGYRDGDLEVTYAFNYGDSEINAAGAGRDTITYFDEDDAITVEDGIQSLAIADTTSLNNFISQGADLLNQGAALQWYDENVGSTYLFISDGSGDLSADDILIQVGEGMDEYTFTLDGNKAVLI